MSERDQRPSGSPWPISPYLTSGIQLAEYLNSLVESVDTNNLGTSRPAYLEAGGIWSKSEGGQVNLYLYTGSADVKIASSNGAGIDIINESELQAWIEQNIDFGVQTFNGRQPDADGNIDPAEGDYTMDQLGDVGISNLLKDDYLQWNGSSWENNPPKLIETEINFGGGIDLTAPLTFTPTHGDLYINNENGTVDNSFVGIAGLPCRVGNAAGYSTNHNANGDKVPDGTGGAWFLLGDIFTAGISGIGAGSGISVDSSNPSEPVVAVNRTTTDGWYAAKDHEHDGSDITSGKVGFAYLPTGTGASQVAVGNHGHSNYALSSHNHDNEYSKLGHGHSEYEPKFSKNSGFNKDFGTGYDNVARGSHTHDGYATSSHTHPLSSISGGTASSSGGLNFQFPNNVVCQSGLNVSGGSVSVAQYINCTGYVYSGSAVRSAGDVIAYYSSDESLKDNIRPIDGVLDKVCQIRSIEFEWNDQQDDYEGTDVGVSAQSVQAVFPSLVKQREKDDRLGVRYEKLAGPIIGAISELRDMVVELQAEVAELKAKAGDA